MNISLAENGKRRFLAKKFQDIVRSDQRFRDMGNTLQAMIVEIINYHYRYGEIKYTSKEKKEGKNTTKILTFKENIEIANVKFDLSFDIPEEKFSMGYL